MGGVNIYTTVEWPNGIDQKYQPLLQPVLNTTGCNSQVCRDSWVCREGYWCRVMV
jgi:hypothetical protein